MAARMPHKVWGYVRLATRPYLIYYYRKCKAGWPAPQPPRPIPPEIPEPPSPIVFVEPRLVPDLAYDYDTPTTAPAPPPDDDPPASGKLLSVSTLLGAAGFLLCLAGILRAKAKEERAARRRLLHLQGGWRAVAADGMLQPPHIGA